MTRDEATRTICYLKEDFKKLLTEGEAEALHMAIEALKAMDRPIICPRCGRTFSEAEGRESEEIPGLEYAENILEDILREQEVGEETEREDE